MQKFYRCKHCGNLVGMLFDSGVPIVCCGEAMMLLVPNTTDAAQEKHVPVVAVEGNTVTVRVGEVEHPMLPEHFIEWIYLKTAQGGQRKSLKPGDAPRAEFTLADGDVLLEVCALCNLHGLWERQGA